MWFNRKLKNRRLGREHVLEVKLRSSQVRAARLRLAAIALGVVFALVFGCLLVWRTGQWALNGLVYENKAFAIQEIDIQTDGAIPVDQLRRWAGVKPGQNLLALDLARVKRDLSMVPLVQSASIERILPHTLRIRVLEREPLAQVNVQRPRPAGGIETAVFYLDAEGFVMPPLESRRWIAEASAASASEPFPVIGGVNPGALQAGRRVETPQVQAALQLLVAFESSPMAGLVDIKRIDVSAPDTLLVLTRQGSEITFGLTDLDQQLRRWRDIFDRGQKLSRAIASLDLAVSNNIPARWIEASVVPSASPKAAKPLRIRKKHV